MWLALLVVTGPWRSTGTVLFLTSFGVLSTREPVDRKCSFSRWETRSSPGLHLRGSTCLWGRGTPGNGMNNAQNAMKGMKQEETVSNITPWGFKHFNQMASCARVVSAVPTSELFDPSQQAPRNHFRISYKCRPILGRRICPCPQQTKLHRSRLTLCPKRWEFSLN
jgi:hypothetical protein